MSFTPNDKPFIDTIQIKRMHSSAFLGRVRILSIIETIWFIKTEQNLKIDQEPNLRDCLQPLSDGVYRLEL